MTTKDLKTRRVEAGITRKIAAEAAGISQFKLDRIERGVDVDEAVRKAYDDGMAKLLAESAKTQSAAKKTPAKKAPAKKTAAKKAAQPKSTTEEPAA